MTRIQFDVAVARFREVAGGTVSVKDFFVPGRAPYRHAWVRVERNRDDFADEAREMALLTEEVDGHMSLNVHRDCVWIESAVSRDLDAEEIGTDPPVSYREVPA